MRYQFVDEIVSLAFDGAAPRSGVSSVADGTSVAETETQVYLAGARVAQARIMFVCASVPGMDRAVPGVGA